MDVGEGRLGDEARIFFSIFSTTKRWDGAEMSIPKRRRCLSGNPAAIWLWPLKQLLDVAEILQSLLDDRGLFRGIFRPLLRAGIIAAASPHRILG